jgi:hypothetical protein
LQNPHGEHARRAAWWAVAEKVGRGHFSSSQTKLLVRAAMEALQDPGTPVAQRLSAAETLRQIPAAGADARRLLRRLAKDDPVIASVVTDGTTSAVPTVRAVGRRLADAALTGVRRDVLQHDPMLEQFVVDMLFHPQGTRRVVAGQAIAATPYRPALAVAIGRELIRPATLADPVLTTALVQALTHLGGPDQAALVQRFVLDPRLPAVVGEAASWVVGHVHGAEGSDFWTTAERQLSGSQARPRSDGLVYSLGTASLRKPGRRTDLARLAADGDLDADLRKAAAWWLAIPDVVRRSVTR